MRTRIVSRGFPCSHQVAFRRILEPCVLIFARKKNSSGFLFVSRHELLFYNQVSVSYKTALKAQVLLRIRRLIQADRQIDVCFY